MGQMEMKCIFDIGKKYFYFGQSCSGERCGPWASCFFNQSNTAVKHNGNLSHFDQLIKVTQWGEWNVISELICTN
jgi:hypothetical protein